MESRDPSAADPSSTRFDFIWNITLVCPWDCDFCCTDAVHVTRNSAAVRIRERHLSVTSTAAIGQHSHSHDDAVSIARGNRFEPTAFDWALADRQRRGLELTYAKKLQVLENILPNRAKFDFAGGDPFSCYENLLVMEHAARLFGRNNISVTVTGAGIGRLSIDRVAASIGQFEFTYDEPNDIEDRSRPQRYNDSNLKLARKFRDLAIRTKAQTPLHRSNIHESTIRRLYTDLADAGIDEILLMRTFPVGRGIAEYEGRWMLSASEARRAIECFRLEEARHNGPTVRLQCALRQLEAGPHKENPCDLMRESFGINPRGQLLLSAWATGATGDALDPAFVVGDLSTSSFADLISDPKWKPFRDRLDDNFGHCKVFAFVFGHHSDGAAMLRQRDPLSDEKPLLKDRWIDLESQRK